MSEFKFVSERMNSIPGDTELYVKKSFDIIERIEELLEEKGISYKDLAAALNKTQPEISRWINGHQNFTLKTITKLEYVLGEDIMFIPCKRNRVVELDRVQELVTKREISSMGSLWLKLYNEMQFHSSKLEDTNESNPYYTTWCRKRVVNLGSGKKKRTKEWEEANVAAYQNWIKEESATENVVAV